jgi:hypothetical protein
VVDVQVEAQRVHHQVLPSQKELALMLKDFLETWSNNVSSEDSGVENSVGTCGGEALKDVPRTCWCCS